LLGYQPQLLDCAGCGEALPEAACWFSPLLGGVLCRKCGAHGQAGSPVSVNALKILRLMAAGDRSLYDRVRLSVELLRELEDALEAQLEYHLDRRLKSPDFIRGIRGQVATAPLTQREAPSLMEKLVSLPKRRRFIYQSSQIYGGSH